MSVSDGERSRTDGRRAGRSPSVRRFDSSARLALIQRPPSCARAKRESCSRRGSRRERSDEQIVLVGGVARRNEALGEPLPAAAERDVWLGARAEADGGPRRLSEVEARAAAA